MESINTIYANKVSLLTEWMSDINLMYFSYKIKSSIPQSVLQRWNSISLQYKQQVIDALFTVKISPFYGCSSKYKTSAPPCVRRRVNNKSGYVDCADGIISDIEASCRQSKAPDYCRKIFLPYVESNSFCSDIKRKSLDEFVEWIFRISSSNYPVYSDVLQARYMADSSAKTNRWK